MTKDISECIGCIKGIYKIISKFGMENGNINKSNKVYCYCIGDGKYAKCGSILSYMTDWNIYSIDPLINNIEVNDNLKTYPELGENCTYDEFKNKDVDFVVVVSCHGHCELENIIKKIRHNLTNSFTVIYVVTLDCCIKTIHEDSNLIIEYDDYSIISAKRKIKLYFYGIYYVNSEDVRFGHFS